MPLILGTNSIKDTGYNVSNSLRFSPASSTGLELNLGTPTNAKKYTISFWVKRDVSSASGDVIAGGTDGSNETFIRMNSNGQFQLKADHGSATSWAVNPNALGRDPSAWYNYILAVDTSQGTASNRVKIYLNGELQSLSTANYPDQNHDSDFLNNDNVIHIGKRNYDDAVHFGGYLCEFVFLDGQTLDATSFGEFDSNSGIWKPIDVSGLTFGNNGFYLEFKQSGTSQNSSGLGADTSGNDNHFAVENLTGVNQSTDTCTNNFATMNPLNVPTSNAPTFAEGNLKTTSGTTGGAYMGSATIGVSSGKWYAEMKVKVIDSMIAGVSANVAEDARDNTYPGQQGNSAGILPDTGNKYINDSGSTHGDAFSANDVLMIALDLDNNNVYFGRNGNWFDGSGNADESSPNSAISLTAAASTTDGFYFFSVGDGGGSAAAAAEWNFGSPMYAISSGNADGEGFGNFEYAVPSGYFSLCTKNLAEYG
jgi:hypothetical protein